MYTLFLTRIVANRVMFLIVFIVSVSVFLFCLLFTVSADVIYAPEVCHPPPTRLFIFSTHHKREVLVKARVARVFLLL